MKLTYTDPTDGSVYTAEGKFVDGALPILIEKMGDKYHEGLNPKIHWECSIEESDEYLRSKGIEV